MLKSVNHCLIGLFLLSSPGPLNVLAANDLELHLGQGLASGEPEPGRYRERVFGLVAGRDVATADFNADGLDDVVVVHGRDSKQADQTPTFWLQQPGSFLAARQSGPGSGLVGARILAADLNNDDQFDLIIGGGDFDAESVSFTYSQTAVYFNSGDWSSGVGFDFDSGLPLGPPEYAPEMAVGDIDSDGDIDVVIGSNGLTPSGIVGEVTIWTNQGGIQGGAVGTFQASAYQESGAPTDPITALSLLPLARGLNRLDLALSREDATGNTRLHLGINDGLGQFTTQITGSAFGFERGAVRINDVAMVGPDHFAIAYGYGGSSELLRIVRPDGIEPSGYEQTLSFGVEGQNIQRLIATNALGAGDVDLVIAGDFDFDQQAVTASAAVYLADPVRGFRQNLQCLLRDASLLVGIANLESQPSGFDSKDDLILLDPNRLYRLVNNASPWESEFCCLTTFSFLGVSGLASRGQAGPRNSVVWLDTFEKLKQIRQLLMPQTPGGHRYASHYANHELQLLDILGQDEGVINAWQSLLISWNPAMQALLNNTDDSYTLSGLQMADLATFLFQLQAYPDVGDTVSAELALLDPLNSYAGRPLREFREDTIGLDLGALFSDRFEPRN